MGFFGRLKSSSSTTFPSNPDPKASSTSRQGLSSSSSQAMLSMKHVPTSPSANSTLSKSSKKSWWKGKMGMKDLSDLGNTKFATPLPSPPSVRFDRTHTNPLQEAFRPTTSPSTPSRLNHDPMPFPLSPPARPIDISPSNHPNNERQDLLVIPSSGKENKPRVVSAEFGGILGRLGFEFGSSPLGGDIVLVDEHGADAQTLVETVRGSLDEQEGGATIETVASPGSTNETLITGAPLHGEQGNAEIGLGKAFELAVDPEEILGSPEKKQRFLRGLGKARRLSKTEAEHVERTTSPTPRVSSPQIYNLQPSTSPMTPSSPKESHFPPTSRPNQLRRLSSNILNTFHRTQSRTSMFEDVANPDDSSFQLKSFRHVSGISDMDSSVFDDHPTPKAINPAGQAGHPEHSAQSTQNFSSPPSRPYLSRPPSMAGSVNDDFASASRVSVGAFRKGIRRTSEGVSGSMSDIGHGAHPDDDDDMPLSQIVKTPDFGRSKSALSLSSMKVETPLGDAIGRRPSPSPGLTFSVTKQARTLSGTPTTGFVVKSSRTTRTIGRTPSPAQHLSDRSPSAESRERSPPPPLVIPVQLFTDSQEIMASPEDVGFSPTSLPPVRTQVPIKTVEKSMGDPQSRSDPGEGSFPLPQSSANAQSRAEDKPILTAHSKRLSLPPPAPLSLPVPVVEPLNLPLPPDQMPDSPPQSPLIPRDLPPRPASASASPSLGPQRKSFLVQPMRVISGISVSGISGLWHGNGPSQDEGQGASFGMRSSGALEDDECLIPPVRDTAASSNIPIPSPTTPTTGNRHTLQERLAIAAQAQPRPKVGHLRIESDVEPTNDDQTEKWRSPISDSETVSHSNPTIPGSAPASSQSEADLRPATASSNYPPVSLSRTPRPKLAQKGRSKSKGWVSSSDEEEILKPVTLTRSRISIRKAPAGPRPLSRSGTITSVRTEVHPPTSEIVDEDKAGSSDEWSEDESLAAIRNKAFTTGQTFTRSPAIVHRSPLPISPSLPNLSLSRVVSPASPRPRPHAIYQRDRSPPSSNRPASSLSISKNRTESQATASRAVRDGSHSSISSAMPRSTASPDSSQSGLTGDSAQPLPITPRERSVDGKSKGRIGEGKGARNRTVSADFASQPQYAQSSLAETQSMHSVASGNSAYHNPALNWSPQSGYMPMPPIDPGLAYQQMLKQQWQASYMAAAYRASEEEWEKASSVSGHTAATQSTSPFFHPAMPGFGQYPLQMPMSMPPAPFGYPPQPVPFMYPYPGMPNPPYGPPPEMFMQAPPSGYGYPQYSAQSVYGGEFGPPSAMPPQLSSSRVNHFDAQNPSVYSKNDNRQQRRLSTASQALSPSEDRAYQVQSRQSESRADQTPRRPAHSRMKSGGTNNSPPPPSSWRRSTDALGQFEKSPTRPSARTRPSTQYN